MKKTLLIGLFLLLFSGCTPESSADIQIPYEGAPLPLKGVSVSPRSFQGQDFADFMDKAGKTQDALLWAGDWIELQNDGAPYAISELADHYGLIPIIEVGHYIQESGELFRPLTQQNRQIYYDSTLAFIEKYHPAYFGMGVEINIFARKNPSAYEDFVPLYNELYDAIKAVSPDTKVFTVFQLEVMKGLPMWEIEGGDPQWDMIDTFQSDLAAFTTYPGLFYRDPADIPADHYTAIAAHTDKPIAFMEIGWHSAPSPQGWESSEAEQAQFLDRFFDLTDGLDPQVAIWTFMYDRGDLEPFSSMGLIRSDGSEKPAWEVWMR